MEKQPQAGRATPLPQPPITLTVTRRRTK